MKLFVFGKSIKFNYSKYYDKTRKIYIKYPHDYNSEEKIIKQLLYRKKLQ
jgi:hypothetical protein